MPRPRNGRSATFRATVLQGTRRECYKRSARGRASGHHCRRTRAPAGSGGRAAQGMPLLISDAAVVRDLERGGLLAALSCLSDEIVITDVLMEREIARSIMLLMHSAGVRTIALEPGEMEESVRRHRSCGSLSLAECCALVVAKMRQVAMLTSYGRLRDEALLEGHSVCCALWCLDEFERSGAINVAQLYACLQAMASKPRSKYPPDRIAPRVARLGSAKLKAEPLSRGAD